MDERVEAGDGRFRCPWSLNSPEEQRHHDTEWGFPVGEDRALFEQLCLESFQSGLSWRTILSKRENFRRAFSGFDPVAVAGYGQGEVEQLLQDSGIVRHRGKIEAAVANAGCALEVIGEFGSLGGWLWQYEITDEQAADPDERGVPRRARELAREMKRRGWKFLGPTTVFAFMQDVGLVNSHEPRCAVQVQVAEARREFRPPVPLSGR